MAELVDALDLGSNEETRTGSSPARPTKKLILRQYHNTMHYVSNIVSFFVCLLLSQTLIAFDLRK